MFSLVCHVIVFFVCVSFIYLLSFINVVILFTNTTFRCKMLSEDVVLVDR